MSVFLGIQYERGRSDAIHSRMGKRSAGPVQSSGDGAVDVRDQHHGTQQETNGELLIIDKIFFLNAVDIQTW